MDWAIVLTLLVCGFVVWKYFTSWKELWYYRRMDRYITTMGFYEKLLTVEGTDSGFCILAMKVRKGGYITKRPEKVIGALLMDAANRYYVDPLHGILFLEALLENFHKDNDDVLLP